jgi:hypothetical protein
MIPRVYNGKDRTFFYCDYEGVRLGSITAAAESRPVIAPSLTIPATIPSFG